MAAAAILSELSGVRQISDAILLSVRFIFALTRVSTALCPPRALVSAQPVPIAHRRVAVGSAGRLLRAGQGRLVRHSCRHDGGKGGGCRTGGLPPTGRPYTCPVPFKSNAFPLDVLLRVGKAALKPCCCYIAPGVLLALQEPVG